MCWPMLVGDSVWIFLRVRLVVELFLSSAVLAKGLCPPKMWWICCRPDLAVTPHLSSHFQ